ncbi:cytochrome C biogenesis protein [Sphingomonas parva]|uniref:Cytochrome C biogenesis protein n=1 Tax=Sphingomonas parva TaxID=2555898 RepID=A0A4Y8ZUN1_9SPHN|nr:tetratricopeptide repeat protein [Sphingomonas parva]TFI58166.1 cytochrome C biogenesis protein [Sphingomonas parva]
MGWFIILIMALIVFTALWHFARLEKGPLQFVVAALLLALAGYAWQGRPDLAGSPRSAAEQAPPPDSPFMTLRREMFGQFDSADRWLIMADNFRRSGNTRDAAGLIRAGLRGSPRNATLWTGYGDVLVAHAGGLLTPAADLAFRRAIVLAPKHPGPHLFRGIALAQNQRFAEAEQEWRKALALAPPTASWRAELERQLALVDQARKAGAIR